MLPCSLMKRSHRVSHRYAKEWILVLPKAQAFFIYGIPSQDFHEVVEDDRAQAEGCCFEVNVLRQDPCVFLFQEIIGFAVSQDDEEKRRAEERAS